jgi:hypothetical protein
MAGTSHRRQQADIPHQSCALLCRADVDAETDIGQTRRYPDATNRSALRFLLALPAVV